ncbi:HTH domain-containing protein [Peribacillus frigoritolerans]|nr:HTH domain-containing protein [Peribacillus frigoritolerans]
MLVRDMVQAIENRELKIQDLADKYDVSDRTIQIKIKELGSVWVATEKQIHLYGVLPTKRGYYTLRNLLKAKTLIFSTLKRKTKVLFIS